VDECKPVTAGPLRVYKQGQGFPGIAMSRSVGDSTAGDLGVIEDPTAGAYTRPLLI
jgi:hypothetical protein